jgi:glutamate N-acetyltransferase/amino-acid N-acetyltransferase
MIFANGASGIKIEEGSDDAILFEEALSNLSNDIARMIASDGEGATKLIEIVVHGAKTEKDAKLVVTSVARSPLVKTAIFGMDANWGRVLTAVGYSGADFDPNKVSIKLCGVKVCENGNAAEYNEEDVKELLHEHDISIDIDLKDGEFDDRMYTCDFSYDYVKINGSYRS